MGLLSKPSGLVTFKAQLSNLEIFRISLCLEDAALLILAEENSPCGQDPIFAEIAAIPAAPTETHLKEGYAEGYKDGLVAGKEEGKQVGLKVGFEVGEELGFYRGCVDVWNSAIRIDPERFSIRVRKSVKQMEELVEKYPLQDPENEQVQELMEGLRLKFRAICATLGVKLEYNGYPKSASDGKEIEF